MTGFIKDGAMLSKSMCCGGLVVGGFVLHLSGQIIDTTCDLLFLLSRNRAPECQEEAKELRTKQQ
jgi:hypothetical protein